MPLIFIVIAIPLFILLFYFIYSFFLDKPQISLSEEAKGFRIDKTFLESIPSIGSEESLHILKSIDSSLKNADPFFFEETLLKYRLGLISLTQKEFQIIALCYLHNLNFQLANGGTTAAMNCFSTFAYILFMGNSDAKNFVNQLLVSYFAKKSRIFKSTAIQSMLNNFDYLYRDMLATSNKNELRFFALSIYQWIYQKEPQISIVDNAVDLILKNQNFKVLHSLFF